MDLICAENAGNSLNHARTACAYVAERVRKKGAARWHQGARLPPIPTHIAAPEVRLFAESRLLKVEAIVAQGLVRWAEGARDVELRFDVPEPIHLLRLQAAGRRCVTLLDDDRLAAPHADGLAFVLHDLCHMEKFYEAEHAAGQRGFFRRLLGAVQLPGWQEFAAEFDETWRADWEHVAADMNGSAIFLWAALKMKLKMAVRRRLARDQSRPAPWGGELSPEETRAYEDALERLFVLMDFRGRLREAARSVSTRRTEREAALELLRVFREDVSGGVR